METHHHVIEWALANAIDPAKFNQRVLPGLLRRNPEKYGPMKKRMSQKQILDSVDHDEDNLWVLCDVHHRHVFVGIHAITFPISGTARSRQRGFAPEHYESGCQRQNGETRGQEARTEKGQEEVGPPFRIRSLRSVKQRGAALIARMPPLDFGGSLGNFHEMNWIAHDEIGRAGD